MRIHFIGLAGAGISALATVLVERGVQVSGSDRADSLVLAALRAAGVQVSVGHAAENVLGADVVVRSSAVMEDNVEVQAARGLGLPVLRRQEFLEQFIGPRRTLAVAGAHGKTTTTAMLAWTLARLGQDPSYVIGGVATNLQANAHAGTGDLFVIEADEYDGMFLGLQPTAAVVTNIEHDHPDCYPTAQDFYAAFQQFAGRIIPGGLLAACADDAGARRLLEEQRQAGRAVQSYGLSPQAGLRAADLQMIAGAGYRFTAAWADLPLSQSVALAVPGLHSVRNALAVLALVQWLGLPLEAAAQALAEFQGVGRRFQVRGLVGGVTLIDDYAHHPTEIRATLAAARERYPGRRVWAVWQPHTYSRLRSLLDDFAAAFDQADAVLVLDVFAAREAAPTDGLSSEQAAAQLRQRHPGGGKSVYGPLSVGAAPAWLTGMVREGDVVVVLSAGDATAVSDDLMRRLAALQTGDAHA
jgi:UDP-N-acetylmuramate--alanine ligase